MARVIAGLLQRLKGDTMLGSLAMKGERLREGNDRSTCFGIGDLSRVYPMRGRTLSAVAGRTQTVSQYSTSRRMALLN